MDSDTAIWGGLGFSAFVIFGLFVLWVLWILIPVLLLIISGRLRKILAHLDRYERRYQNAQHAHKKAVKEQQIAAAHAKKKPKIERVDL